MDAQVLSAASAGQLDALQAALDAGGSEAAADYCGDPALVLAARGGHAACCRLLLSRGADAGQQGSQNKIALMLAVQLGCAELLDVLLPATPDLSTQTDPGCLTVFDLACLHRRPWALRRLIDRQHALAATQGAPSPALHAQAGRAMVHAMFAAVAAGEAECLALLAGDALARAAYAELFSASALADRRQQGALLDELGFLADAAVVGDATARAAAFLWQTCERRPAAAGASASSCWACTQRCDARLLPCCPQAACRATPGDGHRPGRVPAGPALQRAVPGRRPHT